MNFFIALFLPSGGPIPKLNQAGRNFPARIGFGRGGTAKI
jgi:hypothetical protein